MANAFSRRRFIAAAAATVTVPLALRNTGFDAASAWSAQTPAEPATAGPYPWSSGFQALNEERSYWVEEVDGTVPAGLNGTLFRNGPGTNQIAGQWLAHWFDGDGMLSAIGFAQGRVHYRNRYVQTRKRIDESAAGHILYRGFGTMRPGGILANAFRLPENAANTSVVCHGGKLLALWEGGPPYRLRPEDLATLGIDDFDGKVRVFSAHPKIDPRNGELFNFGMIYGRANYLQIYRIDRAGRAELFPAIEMPYGVMNHDFVMTEKYLAFCFGPIMFDGLKMALGLGSFDQELRWETSRPTRILLVRRDRAAAPRWIDAEPFFQFHFANAYDDGGAVVIDVARYPNYQVIGENLRNYWRSDWPTKGSSRLTRMVVDAESGKVESRELAPCQAAEFPRIDPRLCAGAHNFVYIAAVPPHADHGMLQLICKVDARTGKVTSHDFSPHGYVGEPVFVPAREGSGGEEDGYVITLVFDAVSGTTNVVILDARDLSAQPLAVARLPHHVPFGFHGFFVDRSYV